MAESISNDWQRQSEENWKRLKEEDEAAKAKGQIVKRYIQEPRGDGYAFYKIIRENRKTVRIRRITGIGDDWSIPYWGDETTIDKEFAIQNIRRRDSWTELFSKKEDNDG